jgi:hypothetical protein
VPFAIAGTCGIIGPLMLVGLRIDEPIGLLIAA